MNMLEHVAVLHNILQGGKQIMIENKRSEIIYRVSINSFPDYKHLLQENYLEYKNIFFSKCNSTKKKFLQHISTLQHVLLVVFHVVFL